MPDKDVRAMRGGSPWLRKGQMTMDPVELSRAAACCSLMSTSMAASDSPGNITARGFRRLPFRLRRSRMDRSLEASQARWYPPVPLIATIPPSLRSAITSMMLSPDDCSHLASPRRCQNRDGPHSGQVISAKRYLLLVGSSASSLHGWQVRSFKVSGETRTFRS